MTIERAIEIVTNAVQSNESKFTAEIDEALAIVQKTAEKQVPYNTGNKFVGTCKCGKTVYPHMDYCDKCGQALDWK